MVNSSRKVNEGRAKSSARLTGGQKDMIMALKMGPHVLLPTRDNVTPTGK